MDDDFTPELNFPCEYPVKVFGRNEEHFAEFVIDLVCRHAADLTPESFSVRASSGGKYLAVSATFLAQSRQQIDALYAELGSHERILTAM